MPAPDGAHVLLDLGAEEYTRGVPHPMIDPSGRLALLRSRRTIPT
jgi:FdrA protein